uniref:VCBS repeat-containing protein n=1 Tax=candidate division WOR-3 bacterium TaxID=2052148 RepID=A0A7V3ZW70_UNCW3
MPFVLILFFSYFDSLIIYSQGSNITAISSGKKFKNLSDDTIRIFFLDSLKPYLYLLSEVGNNYPPSYRLDSFNLNEIGYRKITVGDVDNDSLLDIIISKVQPPYFLKRLYFQNNSLRSERIDSVSLPIMNILLADIDNDGKDEVFYFTYDKLKMAKRENNYWRLTEILTNLYQSEDYGLSFGNFDNQSNEGELACVINPYGTSRYKLLKINYFNNNFDTATIFERDHFLHKLTIDDFDNNWEGKEIALTGIYSSRPILFEIYGFGDSFHYSTILSSNVIGEGYNDVKVDDFYSLNNGKEILLIATKQTWNFLFLIYQENNIWQIETIFSQHLSPYSPLKSLLIGDFWQNRQYNKEILFFNFNKIYLLYQSKGRPTILEIDNHPKIPQRNEGVIVKAKVRYPYLNEIYDTLYYSLNDTFNFQYKLKDSFSLIDSTFYYSFPPYDTNNKIFYYLKVKTPYGEIIKSPLKFYEIAYPRKIKEIQYTNDPQGISPDTNKYVATYGIVTAVFGNKFFIEERPKSFWNGIFVIKRGNLARVNMGDSIFLIGKVKELNKLTTIYCDADSGGRLVILSNNLPLVDTYPTAINLLAESLESKLILLDSLYFLDSGNFSPNSFYWAYNLRGERIRIKIEGESEIPGMVIPLGLVEIIGNLGEDLPGYYLLPRLRSDFIIITGIKENKKEILTNKEKKIYNILGDKVKEKKLKRGIYFIKENKGFKKIVIKLRVR